LWYNRTVQLLWNATLIRSKKWLPVIENYRENGGVVGRKEGFKKPDRLYLTEYSKELELLRRGVRLKDIRVITGTAINTLRKLKSKFLTPA